MDLKKIFARRYEITLAIIFVLLLSSLAVVGYLASARFSAITESLIGVRSVSYPRAEVERIRSLMSESELAVKAFSLTRDKQFLDDYLDISYEVIDAFEALEEDSSRHTEEVRMAIDSLDKLVFKRMDMYGVILAAGDEFRVARAMNEVTSAVAVAKGQKPVEMDVEDVEEPEEKPRGLRKFFNRDQKEEVPEPTGNSVRNDPAMLASIDANIAQISARQRSREKEIREALLRLTLDGEKVNEEIDKISSLLTTLELQDQEAQAQEVALLSTASSRVVNIGITLLVVLIAIFMLMIVLMIRNNRRYARATQLASERAIELANSKENFVANVSHELRTPLNAIIGYVDILDKQSDDQQKGRSRRRIRHAAQHLHGLINDLLDWTKIEAGGFQITMKSFRMDDLITQVSDIVHTKSEEGGVDLVVDTDLQHHVFNGDPIRLRQVLINLLGNAFKFTEKGQIELSVKEVPNDEGAPHIEFVVNDTGVGIPESEHYRVFEVFEQSEFATAKSAEGSGLGLPISKRLVEMMGGEMELKSTPGKGTTVRFYLPLQPEMNAKQEVDEVQAPQLAGKRVLLVDDHPFNLEVLASYMQDTGAELLKAKSADEALAVIESHSVDIAILDIRMPDKDGYELAKAIPEEKKKQMYMIALTALDRSGIAEQAQEAGFHEVLPKPIDKHVLYAALGSHVAPNETLSEAKHSNDATDQGTKVLNQDVLRLTFGDDEAFKQQMLAELMEQLESELQAIYVAIQSDDRVALDDLVHKNLPACRQIGAEELVHEMTEVRKALEQESSQGDISAHIPSLKRNFERLKERVHHVVEG